MKESMDSLLADMERAGVDTSIAVTSCNINFIDEYTRQYDEKLFVGYLYDSRNPKEGLRALRRTVEKFPHLVKCVKTMLPYLGQQPLQKDLLPLYRFCENAGLPIQFHIGGDPSMEKLSNPLYFARLSSEFPDLHIICLHAGGGAVEAMPVLLELYSNIFLEVEGLQLNEAEGSREPNVLRFLLQNIDSSRLMFGSDRIFPEEKYFWRVQAAQSAAPEHVDNLCWKTANKLFHLELEKKRRPKAAASKSREKKGKKSTKRHHVA
jgi:predicted TIM-barrel fold metal-dependent hydrolase